MLTTITTDEHLLCNRKKRNTNTLNIKANLSVFALATPSVRNERAPTGGTTDWPPLNR